MKRDKVRYKERQRALKRDMERQREAKRDM